MTDDWTRKRLFHPQCAIALAECIGQRRSKGLKLTHARVDVCQVLGQYGADALALLAAPSVRGTEQLANLLQFEPELLRLLDESKARDRVRRIDTESAFGPPRFRHQAEALVVPDGVWR